ncbi:MAG: V-type ATP synthase subunit E [Actinomycetota bacterium]|nr:V-type ATP synthase subunit E [Actinomycetota bacterium]
MALEDILESLDAEARKQSADIIDRAQSQAEKLIAEAKEDAGQILAASKKAAIENLRSQEAKVLLEARFKAKKRVAEAKEVLTDKVFAEAQSRIASMWSRPIYKEVFKHLVREALGENNNSHSGLTVQVSPRDVDLAKDFFSSKRLSNNVRIVGRDDIKSGVAMVVDGGRKTGINTLESRFQKVQKLLRTKVGATLFDDDN